MTTIDSTNVSNAMRRVIQGYIYTLSTKNASKEKFETDLSSLL